MSNDQVSCSDVDNELLYVPSRTPCTLERFPFGKLAILFPINRLYFNILNGHVLSVSDVQIKYDSPEQHKTRSTSSSQPFLPAHQYYNGLPSRVKEKINTDIYIFSRIEQKSVWRLWRKATRMEGAPKWTPNDVSQWHNAFIKWEKSFD